MIPKVALEPTDAKRLHISPKISHQTKSPKTTKQEPYSSETVAIALIKNRNKNIIIPPRMSPRITPRDTRR
jgi:hypothetical protein